MKTPSPSAQEDLAVLIGADGSRRSGRWKFWLVACVLLAITGYLGWRKWEEPAEAQPRYVTEDIRRGDIELTVTATGNLEPTNEVTIGSELSGTAQEVYVDYNDRVSQGQALAKIDIRRLAQQIDSSRAALNSAKAKVNQVKATLQETEATLARLQELHQLSGGKTPSKADMVAAESAVVRAKADLGSAEAAVEEAEANLRANENDQEKAVLRSPIDGIVLTRSLEPGQTVAASFTAPELFVIAENLEHMKLSVAVAEADIGRVAAGQPATFTVDAWPDRAYTATVTKVSFGSKVTDNVVTYETELDVSNKDLSLRPGMTATADIRVARSGNVLLVPSAALRFDPQEAAAGAAPASAQKKSFVDSLIPRPRRSSGMGAKGENASGPAPKRKPGEARVWVLREGKPVPLPVEVGLADGRHAEVSGDGVVEGLAVIVRVNRASNP